MYVSDSQCTENKISRIFSKIYKCLQLLKCSFWLSFVMCMNLSISPFIFVCLTLCQNIGGRCIIWQYASRLCPEFEYLNVMHFYGFQKHNGSWFLDVFSRSQKFTISFIVSVCLSICLSVHIQQLCFHWICFHEIWYMNISWTSVKKI